MSSDNSNKSDKIGWFSRLKSGMSKSSNRLSSSVSGIVSKRIIDSETLLDLEDILIGADLGVEMSMRIVNKISLERVDKKITDNEIKQILAREVEAILKDVAKPLEINDDDKPHIILFVGVNGTGKTTTIGKLASKLNAQGKKVCIAAADTFRAAAIEQLSVWAKRSSSHFISKEIGSDAAGVAFDAQIYAKENDIDVLLIDTAGRLQNKEHLMDELAKINRVLKKQDEHAPHKAVIVLDATTGQNAISQVEAFQKTADISGIIMTKFDGTAKGGILVALAQKFKLPIHAIGVGEGIEDLHEFAPEDFAKALCSVE